jgi:zinc transporter, ZIP family
MAGASTCVGAAVVFCFSPQQIKQSMSFSLSLAASVMITVSVISIGPECWRGIVMPATTNNLAFTVNAWLLLERLLSFAAGCGGYFLLSKLLGSMPDPEHLFLLGSKKNDQNDAQLNERRVDLSKMIDEEERMALIQQRQRRSASYDSSMSGSVDMEMENDYVVEDTIVTTVTNQAGKPVKMKHNHRLRRKNTTQTTGSTSEIARNGPGHLTKSSSADSLEGENYDYEQPDELYDKDASAKQLQKQRSWRVAMLLFFSLLAHNFPEGLCVAASAKESPQLGITVAIGIFIHNVPEGIAISVPCIAARPESPWLAFWLASISGLAEPIGAMVALLVLQNTKLELENVLASVAGVMCMVAAMELYPEAIRQLEIPIDHGNAQDAKKSSIPTAGYESIIWGTLAGMGLMIATEWYLPS